MPAIRMMLFHCILDIADQSALASTRWHLEVDSQKKKPAPVTDSVSWSVNNATSLWKHQLVSVSIELYLLMALSPLATELFLWKVLAPDFANLSNLGTGWIDSPQTFLNLKQGISWFTPMHHKALPHCDGTWSQCNRLYKQSLSLNQITPVVVTCHSPSCWHLDHQCSLLHVVFHHSTQSESLLSFTPPCQHSMKSYSAL